MDSSAEYVAGVKKVAVQAEARMQAVQAEAAEAFARFHCGFYTGAETRPYIEAAIAAANDARQAAAIAAHAMPLGTKSHRKFKGMAILAVVVADGWKTHLNYLRPEPEFSLDDLEDLPE